MKKNYIAPGILSVEMLEQTSLACTGTLPVVSPNYGPGDLRCSIDAHKSPAFLSTSPVCTIGIDPDFENVTVLS